MIALVPRHGTKKPYFEGVGPWTTGETLERRQPADQKARGLLQSTRCRYIPKMIGQIRIIDVHFPHSDWLINLGYVYKPANDVLVMRGLCHRHDLLQENLALVSKLNRFCWYRVKRTRLF